MKRLGPGGAAALVGLVALAAALAGLGNEFAYDDRHMIEDNPRLHGLAGWRLILSSPYWPPPWNPEHYRPLTSLWLAFQHGIGGGAPLVFRLVSYALYAASALAVYGLARRLLPGVAALGIALLFAAHPVHVEAVAPAVSQSELIVALLAVLLTAYYLDRRRQGDGRLLPRDWLLLGLGYLGASLTKEHGLVLPGLLLTAELFLVQGPARDRLRRLAPGYLALAALGALVLLARMAVLGGQLAGNWKAEALDGAGLGTRALTLLQMVPQWFRLLVWPAHLQADYSPQDTVASTGLGPPELLGALLLVLSALAIWRTRRAAPPVAFGLAFAAVAVFPTTNLLLLTSTLLAERQLFLPSVGFLIALGGAVAWGWDTIFASLARRRVLAVALAALVLAGVARSVERQRTWRNEAFFSVRAVQDAPRSYRTQRAYGEVLFELGRRELALDAYRQSLELAPPDHVWRVRNDLARRLRALGESEPESEQLRLSLADRPDQLDTRGFLIAAYLALGRYPEAASQADSALARGGDPQVFRGLRSLADSAARVGAPPGTVRIRVVTAPLPGTAPRPGG